MSHVIGRGRYARETYPRPPASGGGGSNVKTQQLVGSNDITSATFVAINEAPSTNPGSFPDVAIDVTPGSKVLIQFAAVNSGNDPAVRCNYDVQVRDGAAGAFVSIQTSGFVSPPLGDGGNRAYQAIQAEYVATEPDQTVKVRWNSNSSTLRANIGISGIGPCSLRVEEVPV